MRGQSRGFAFDWQRLKVLKPRSREALLRAQARDPLARQKILEKKQQRGDEPSEDARAMVRNMASYGFSLHQILRYTGLHKAQMRHLKHELQTAAITRDLTVAQSGYLQAVGGPDRNWKEADGAMTRFWLERRMGWRAPPDRLMTLNANMDLDKLSEAQLEQLEKLMEIAHGE